ncbi:MAG: SDR family oxidoreductase [Acidobacteria bacterium]|nr:MAG: SDR family oxidoreductase [Acidobacteriota bacterium]
MNRGFALVTGASRGIGAALAAALARAGYDLLLTARSAADLESQREHLQKSGGEVRIVCADLAQGGAGQVTAAAANLPLTLLVNNAGVGSFGEFTLLPGERELEQVRLNLEATIALTHGLLPQMLRAGRGAILNVASTAALQPVPYMATYAATKVFLLHFSLALREELRGSGIHVMALCPGPTRTNFFAASHSPLPPGLQSAEAVAALALRGLRQRKAVVICQPRAAALSALERLLPRTTVTHFAGKVVGAWKNSKSSS